MLLLGATEDEMCAQSGRDAIREHLRHLAEVHHLPTIKDKDGRWVFDRAAIEIRLGGASQMDWLSRVADSADDHWADYLAGDRGDPHREASK